MKQKQTYDYICFSDLAYEFDNIDFSEAEKKIKRRLKYYRLASYNQEKVDYIRRLKNDVYKEISLRSKSKYFNKVESNYSDFTNFFIVRMTSDFLEKYHDIDRSDITRILNSAIYLYYMR